MVVIRVTNLGRFSWMHCAPSIFSQPFDKLLALFSGYHSFKNSCRHYRPPCLKLYNPYSMFDVCGSQIKESPRHGVGFEVVTGKVFSPVPLTFVHDCYRAVRVFGMCVAHPLPPCLLHSSEVLGSNLTWMEGECTTLSLKSLSHALPLSNGVFPSIPYSIRLEKVNGILGPLWMR